MELTAEEKLAEMKKLIDKTEAGTYNPGWWFRFKEEARVIMEDNSTKGG